MRTQSPLIICEYTNPQQSIPYSGKVQILIKNIKNMNALKFNNSQKLKI